MPPTILISALEGIRRRLRVMSVAFGAGIVIGAAVGLLLAVVLLDWLLNLPNVPRLVLMLAAVGTLAYLLYGWVISPLLAKLSIRDVASHLERAFPQFEDRLRSTVDFVRGDVPGSDLMKQRVVGETAKLASSLDLSQAIVMRPVWYSLGGAVLSVALLIALTMLASPQFMKIAASRLFTPMHAMAWPKSTEIQMLGDVPTRVPVGQRVDVRMKLAKGDRESAKAIVFTQYGHVENGRFVADTQPQQEFMSRGADGSYAASLDARVEAPNANGAAASGLMRVWITSGDDQTNLQDIVVVARLAIRGVSATIEPPAYVGVDHTTTFDLTKGPAVMPMGSKVKLDVVFNKPLAGEAKDVTIEPIDAKPDKPGPQIVSSSFVADSRDGVTHVVGVPESVRFHVRARDTDGFTNAALEEYELIVRPDQTPSVQIENPRRNEERTNVSVVPLQGLAEDDYGIASLKLVVDRVAVGSANEKATAKHWEIPLVASSGATNSASFTRAEGGGDRLRWRLNYSWDLAQLEKTSPLKPGDVIEYWLVATDNFSLAGQTHAPVNSGKLRISIISQEDLTARIVDDLRNVKQNIGQTKNNQDRTKQETNTLAEDTKNKQDFDAADKTAAERLANQQATSATQSKALAGKLEAIQQRLDENKSNAQELKDIARDVKNGLNDAAENAMKDAAQQISAANQSKSDPSKRNDALNKAQQDQGKASDQLQRAMDRMENIGTLQQTIDAINKILEQQRNVSKETADVGSKNLGKKPEEMSPEDRDRLNKAAEQQAKLAQDTNKALSNMQKTADQMKQSDPSSSEAMKQAAQTGQNQQVSQNQNKAAQQAKQNQQSQAQATQKQVELGLQMVLNQLKEAERRKLAELSKQLAELQKQVGNLVRRQAGHNIDNLSLTDRLAKMESKDRTALFTKAERDEAKPVQTTEQNLSNGQELTERNTRDISKSAEDVPNSAEVVGQLLKAAGKMERAIVFLRDRKLTDAYEPPQVEALAALEDAKRRVDEMKQDADDKINQEKKEAIRQQYVKIKQEQDQLNAETTAIETSRDPQGQLNRQQDVRLNQLPGVQGGLGDRVKKIDEALSAIGSIVYSWANQDIMKSMGEVKDQLGQRQTGVPTQAEQKRISDQLQAMIDNLAEHPVQSKFAQDAGGGNGGQGQQQGPRLPTEAELRLLKAFQVAVNTQTKTLNDQKDKDKPGLLATGNRQGELRNLLGQLLEKASQGQVKLGPEPDNRDQLPEEAGAEQVENQELDKELLTGEPTADKIEKQTNLIGDRMGRSRQRLAINNDPGKTTQIIQDRILQDMDILIEQSRRQLAQARNMPPQQGEQQQQNQPNQQQANNQGQQQQQQVASNPAQTSRVSGQQHANANPGRDIKGDSEEWGKISPRLRDAVMEGGNDQMVEEYKRLIEDYYKAVSTKQSERQ